MFYYLLAQETTSANGPGAASYIQNFGFLAVIVLIMYFLIIAPQRKKDKKRAEMRKSLKKNDKVVTIGGIHGVVKSLTEDEVVLVVDETKDVKMKFSRQSVLTVKDRPSE